MKMRNCAHTLLGTLISGDKYPWTFWFNLSLMLDAPEESVSVIFLERASL